MLRLGFGRGVGGAQVVQLLRQAKKKKGGGGGGGGGGKLDNTHVNFSSLQDMMNKAMDTMKSNLASVRTGVASPIMLNGVVVKSPQGQEVALSKVAQIVASSPQLLSVKAFDPGMTGAVTSAIQQAGLNLNPTVEGHVVRVPVPKATKQQKDALLKKVAEHSEAGKANIRRVRKAGMDEIKAAKDGISKDDVKRLEKQVQTLHDDYIKQIATVVKEKEGELKR